MRVRARLIERVDRAFGARAISHLAIGERDRRHDRVIGDRDVVVPLHPLALTYPRNRFLGVGSYRRGNPAGSERDQL
ncbi:MAG TPA: hypothetical protein VK617_16475 [Gemmatimonadaceae bacterium]|nr:hypothetical protein [Gemmatimonadaceae bacterium]